ncbi:YrdB family protein [Geodermatophilus sp. SYSU D00965]
MVQAWQWTWAGVAFATELGALAALGLWGWSAGGTTALRWLLALGVPLTAALLWGLFAAPQAVVQVAALAVLTKVVVFGAAGAALLAAGSPRAAAVLVVAAVLGSVLSGPLTAQPAPQAAVSAPPAG